MVYYAKFNENIFLGGLKLNYLAFTCDYNMKMDKYIKTYYGKTWKNYADVKLAHFNSIVVFRERLKAQRSNFNRFVVNKIICYIDPHWSPTWELMSPRDNTTITFLTSFN